MPMSHTAPYVPSHPILAETVARGQGAPSWLTGSLIGLGMMATYVALGLAGFFHWMVANGVLFAALWVLPRRWWPWLFVATIAARSFNGMVISQASGIPGSFLLYWPGPVQYVLGNVLEPFLVVTGVLLLRRWRMLPFAAVTTDWMARLHIAAAVSGFAIMCKDLMYVMHEGRIGDVRQAQIVNMVPIAGEDAWAMVAAFAVKNFLGTFVGIILVAPLAAWCATPAHRGGSRPILRDALRYLVPIAAVYLGLSINAPGSTFADLLRPLLMVSVVVFAMRHGWRGAALSVLAASLVIALDDHLGLLVHNPIRLQLFIAITGAMALLLGVTIDDMRRQTTLLHETNRKAEALAEELNAAAARNLHAEERERRRLAADLHDEFGQNLTALQTHLKLAAPDFAAAGRPGLSDSLLELTRSMRQNIGSVLEALRPAALHELGLYAAIDRGSVRRLAEDAGLDFETGLEGDARLLGNLHEAHRTAAYRLVQEAVTNIIRHARATRCSVRLRVSQRDHWLWLFVEVRDDGIGGANHIRSGRGLATMHDRALALGGRLHLRDLSPGLRLHALVRQRLPVM